jgi:integrase
MTTFSKVQERDKLKARRDPYWTKVSKGCYLGFRKMSTGADGTWSARYLDETTGKQVYKKLTTDFSALADHLRYQAAQTEALAWFAHLGKGGSAQAVSVADACKNYVTHLRDSKGDRAADDAQARFDRYVLGQRRLAGTDLSKLTPANIDAWRKTLRNTPAKPQDKTKEATKPRAASTLNRDMTCFRAALNLAFRDGLVTSDFAWRSKLLPVKGADRRREVYLTPDQRRKLVAHLPADAADLLRGLSLVPLRPGALAGLTVASYDKRLKMLTIGKDKAGKDRKIALPDATAAFFADHCKNKLPTASLLTRSNGKPWGKDAWKHPIHDAVAAANNDASEAEKLPAGVTCYTMRHSVITDLIHGGLDALTVAQLSGTSIVMIERHYGHLTQEHARAALARLTL